MEVGEGREGRPVAVEEGADVAERALEDRFGEVRRVEMLDRQERGGRHPRAGEERQEPPAVGPVERQGIRHGTSPFRRENRAYYIMRAV